MKRTTLTARLVATFGAGALVLSACGGGGGAPSGSASGETPEPTTGIIGGQEDCDNPVEGGTLTLADFSEARSLNPTQTIASAFAGGTALAAVYDVLVRYNPETQEFEPHLAEDVTSNEDFTEWTVTLRDGVTFSDGTPLNAQAVVDSANWYLTNRGFEAAVIGPHLAGIRAEGDNTVVFDLTTPWATFPALLGQGIGMIVAPAAISGPEFQPIGAGPFTLDRYAPQEELVLNARDGYWDDDPYLDQLRFVWLGNDDARFETLESEGADVTVLRDPGVVQEARDAGYSGYSTVQSLGNIIMVNNAEGRPGADPRVRQALALAVDPSVLNERVFGGVDIASKALFSDLSRWHAEDVEITPLDVEQARALVEEAKADGFDGTIRYLGNASPGGRDQALALQAMLENAGFTVETELLQSTADIIQRVFVSRDYDLSQAGLSITEEDPFQRLYSSFHSESLSSASGYANPEMDALITELQGTEGDERQDVLTRIEELFQETMPVVSLSPVTPFFPWQDDVHGVKPTVDGMLLFGDAWIGECS
ncbi:peptide/nickel transport system substrate-binding protein [Blastococcus sp. DSM 46786]|uniref:ABC transporter substrate-binding protein n=1 Tax=Blastococcus sp. DSM 46786 TaxID=1798227 RepID=UPI0008C0A2DA|nr:ABC transporter substrate-binding protein [Blastococcus sp. DSM 46786]SEK70757.1 peptide/nickel transport system substrate-binding protein [Blastococcus sp. DSM 46786]